MYLEKGSEFLNDLQGMFAFVLYDEAAGRYLIARDPIGIIPLYYGFDDEHQLFVASEMKALMDVCNVVMEFPPGHYWAVVTSSQNLIISVPGRILPPLNMQRPVLRRWAKHWKSQSSAT